MHALLYTLFCQIHSVELSSSTISYMVASDGVQLLKGDCWKADLTETYITYTNYKAKLEMIFQVSCREFYDQSSNLCLSNKIKWKLHTRYNKHFLYKEELVLDKELGQLGWIFASKKVLQETQFTLHSNAIQHLQKD